MKVRELQKRLNQLNPELDVICYSEDEQFVKDNKGFILLEINEVTVTHGQRTRLEDGTPFFKFGKGKATADFVFIDISADV